MTPRVVFRPEAVIDARDYYERQRTTLGDQFSEALDETISLISDNPKLFAVVLRRVRRTKLRRFPYVVYYRILTDRVEIIGVLHGSRDSRTWKNR